MKRILYIFLLGLFVMPLSAQTYNDLVKKALDFTEKGDYPAAEMSYLAALRNEPANAANSILLANLGTIQRYLGKYDEALVSYEAAMVRYPETSVVLHNRALLYCEMGQLGNALQDYTTILKQNPDDIEALYQRALIYMTNRLLVAAKADFERIESLSPDNMKAKSGLLLLLKRDGQWAEAEEAYTDLLSKNRSNAELYFNRAECYLQLNKLARAQEDLKKAAELGYTDTPFYILSGQLRLAQYDKRSAREDFLKAKELGANETVINELLRLCK